MLRAALWTLRQPRYAATAAVCLALALVFVAAGTWQIFRFEDSVRVNDALKHNAHAASVPLNTLHVPLVGAGPAPTREAVRYRTVTITGTYFGTEQFVRDQSVDGTSGYWVLSPLRTADGVLLVVRGLVPDNDGTVPPPVQAPPTGQVDVTGRLQTTTTGNDGASELTNNVLESINPVQQASRLGLPVLDTYLTLDADQPGTGGVQVLPDPDLSNPAGGAYEAQHFAYIVQWYLFALIALAAPFVIGRSEVRDAQKRFLGLDRGAEEFGTPDRPKGDALVLRGAADLVRAEPSPQQWEQASRLADRYGRSLGPGTAVRPGPRRRRSPVRVERDNPKVPDSDAQPHRSHDAHHGAYNDYLWELAMADGELPAVELSRRPEPDDDEV